MTSIAPGWYPNDEQWETYWDGAGWTDQHRPVGTAGMPAPPAPPAAERAAESFAPSGAMMSFKSHIAGKNADVEIFPDRIEWRMARGVSSGKVTAGVLTGGLSMLATGVRNGKAGTEMIPMKSITGVSTKRDGLINTIVTVTSSSSAIGFRVSHKEAEQMRVLLNQLILG